MIKTILILNFAAGVLLAAPTGAVGDLDPLGGGRIISGNTPRFVASARNLGPEDPSQVIDVTVWLNLHDQRAMDQLAEEVYDPLSVNYRRWLKPVELAERFAPTAREVQTVREFLVTHNLRVVAVDQLNFFVRARGTVADVEKAFRVAIDNFDVNGATYRANTQDPYVPGAAASVVSAISGLDNAEFHHPYVARRVLGTGSRRGMKSAVSGADSSFFTSDCFQANYTDTFVGGDGGFPEAIYKGNVYNPTQNPGGCGYTPAQIHKAYNLDGVYKEGFDGTGQTIAIIDWCGSRTIAEDVNAFSAQFGLPPMNSTALAIIPYPEPSKCAAPDVEINIDVEWAHAIAPGAKIALIVPPTPTFEDVDTAQLYAITNRVGNVISGSYASEEFFDSLTELNIENRLNEMAALTGISANFASGDYGDYTLDYPGINPVTVSAPAASPYATAVGGVTLALKSDNSIEWQTGWGNNQTLLVEPSVLAPVVFDPPDTLNFIGGSGGGTSAVFPKPSFQKSLPGRYRKLPDISWVADPFTGVVIAITQLFVSPPLEWQVWGGTSVSTPMFSALWAIANQEAGAPLGQAARYLYSMPNEAITDVLPIGSCGNVSGTIYEPGATNKYSAEQLAGLLDGTTEFYSALWDIPLEDDLSYVITFGTDSGLKTTPGWDNVTGLGTPNGKAFADFFNPAH